MSMNTIRYEVEPGNLRILFVVYPDEMRTKCTATSLTYLATHLTAKLGYPVQFWSLKSAKGNYVPRGRVHIVNVPNFIDWPLGMDCVKAILSDYYRRHPEMN